MSENNRDGCFDMNITNRWYTRGYGLNTVSLYVAGSTYRKNIPYNADIYLGFRTVRSVERKSKIVLFVQTF